MTKITKKYSEIALNLLMIVSISGMLVLLPHVYQLIIEQLSNIIKIGIGLYLLSFFSVNKDLPLILGIAIITCFSIDTFIFTAFLHENTVHITNFMLNFGIIYFYLEMLKNVKKSFFSNNHVNNCR